MVRGSNLRAQACLVRAYNVTPEVQLPVCMLKVSLHDVHLESALSRKGAVGTLVHF